MRGRAVIRGISRPRRTLYLIRAGGRDDCRTHRRLLDEYNRAFNSWVAYTGPEEGHVPIDTTTTEEVAVARVEEKHQQLLKHEQCCPNCKEG